MSRDSPPRCYDLNNNIHTTTLTRNIDTKIYRHNAKLTRRHEDDPALSRHEKAAPVRAQLRDLLSSLYLFAILLHRPAQLASPSHCHPHCYPLKVQLDIKVRSRLNQFHFSLLPPALSSRLPSFLLVPPFAPPLSSLPLFSLHPSNSVESSSVEEEKFENHSQTLPG